MSDTINDCAVNIDWATTLVGDKLVGSCLGTKGSDFAKRFEDLFLFVFYRLAQGSTSVGVLDAFFGAAVLAVSCTVIVKLKCIMVAALGAFFRGFMYIGISSWFNRHRVMWT